MGCMKKVNKDGGKSTAKKLSKEERLIKQKEGEIKSLILEVTFYVLFLALLVTTASNNRDSKAFGYRQSTLDFIDSRHEILKIREPAQFWKWFNSTMLPFLYPTRKLNGDLLLRETRLVSNLASYRVGPLRIRQHRVRNESCQPNPHFSRHHIRCVLAWSRSHMDSQNYSNSWTTERHPSEDQDLTHEWTAWDYRGWSQVGGVPHVGRFGVYPSGGYVADISGSYEEAKASLGDLQARNWVDTRTRFISVEVTLFCPGANLFGMVPVVFEFTQANVMFGAAHLYPFRLYSYLGSYPTAQMACDALVYLAVAWFVARELHQMYQLRCAYFKEVWNILELVNLLLSIAAIVLYIGRQIVTTYLSKQVTKATGHFYNFQTIAMWDELFTILLGFVCFLSTLQLLHLLRFNRRMSLLAATLREAGKDLVHFSLVFLLVFMAFVSFSLITFGSSLIEYSNVIRAIETLVTVSLGDFDYYALTYVNFILAPIFLFLYMMFIVFILINMLVTILNDAFATVREDASKQPNDYELIDYMLTRIRGFFWALPPVRILWGKARKMGIVDAEAPEIAKSPDHKKKQKPRKAGVNFRPRNRNRDTFNYDLLRLHVRLEALDCLVSHFTHTLATETRAAERFQKKKVSFQANPMEDWESTAVSLDESWSTAKEQIVPGDVVTLKPSISEFCEDVLVPNTNTNYRHRVAPFSPEEEDGGIDNDFASLTVLNGGSGSHGKLPIKYDIQNESISGQNVPHTNVGNGKNAKFNPALMDGVDTHTTKTESHGLSDQIYVNLEDEDTYV